MARAEAGPGERRNSDGEDGTLQAGSGGDGRQQQGASHASPWEWATGAVSLLLVLGVVAFLGLQAARTPDVPPVIELSVDTMIVAGTGFLVEFTASNTGGRTVSRLQVEGVLDDGSGEPERSQTVIEHVPSGGERKAGLFFTRDPRAVGLELRPVGFDQP